MNSIFDSPPAADVFENSEAFARDLDERDPLGLWREEFHVPPHPRRHDGSYSIYFCGNSLGLMPKNVRDAVEQELADWARLGVEGHFEAETPWYSYHEVFQGPVAKLVGALPHEVVMMNSLTVNLHLMMVSFYQPTAKRNRILIDGPTFPSDVYAVKSQIAWRGLNPKDALIQLMPRDGESTLRTEDILHVIAEEGDSIALVLFAGVNYATGQLYDIESITRAAKAKGCVIGWDLAHAAGNVPLQLHDWGCDFAAWCSYKYLNSGPGAVAGCFVHERHARNLDLPRFAGWWGNDPDTRFRMEPEFRPRDTADTWQLSNPPVFALAPMKASYGIFDEVGMPALRAKSLWLTGYLEWLIDGMNAEAARIVTPRDPAARGCQLSIQIARDAKSVLANLQEEGVICDFREPDIIRVAPVPLYNTFGEVWRFASILRDVTQR